MSVLVVSFGERDGALRWIEETSCPYDVVLDHDRKIYTSLGLFRSVFKVWSVSNMLYYAEQVTAGRSLPKPYENVHDDPIQMGGDFVLKNPGTIVMHHPSQFASDRPPVDDILSSVKNDQSN